MILKIILHHNPPLSWLPHPSYEISQGKYKLISSFFFILCSFLLGTPLQYFHHLLGALGLVAVVISGPIFLLVNFACSVQELCPTGIFLESVMLDEKNEATVLPRLQPPSQSPLHVTSTYIYKSYTTACFRQTTFLFSQGKETGPGRHSSSVNACLAGARP